MLIYRRLAAAPKPRWSPEPVQDNGGPLPSLCKARGPVRAHCTRLRGGWTLRHLHHDEIRAVLVAVGPLTVLRHHRAGLALVRGWAPSPSLIGFCSLAHFTIVSTSENWSKPVQISAQWKV